MGAHTVRPPSVEFYSAFIWPLIVTTRGIWCVVKALDVYKPYMHSHF